MAIPVELDEGEALPELEGYDALWVMGGPMDVWQEDEYPWLVAEKALIKDALMADRAPNLGIITAYNDMLSAHDQLILLKKSLFLALRVELLR